LPVQAGTGCGVPLGGSAPAWRDPVLVKIADSRHPWHAAGMLHLLGATSSGRQHWAAVARLATADLALAPQTDPDGAPWIWLPVPGGHEKFDLFYDEPSRTYWLAGSRGTPGLPLGAQAAREEGLHRLGLWASENLVDWRWAAPLVAGGEGPAGIRCDPSVATCGNDLVWICRAGGSRSRNARETAQVTCGRVVQFRARNG
jgi:hypothetical protein